MKTVVMHPVQPRVVRFVRCITSMKGMLAEYKQRPCQSERHGVSTSGVSRKRHMRPSGNRTDLPRDKPIHGMSISRITWHCLPTGDIDLLVCINVPCRICVIHVRWIRILFHYELSDYTTVSPWLQLYEYQICVHVAVHQYIHRQWNYPTRDISSFSQQWNISRQYHISRH